MPLSKEQVLEGLKKLREGSVKRKFVQSIDLQVCLKSTDTKKPENKLKETVLLPHITGKKVSVAFFADKELVDDGKNVFDEVIKKDDFKTYTKKRDIKKLVRRHKFFVAQGNLMGDIAQQFGKFLGPIGRMPDPKAGCVIPIKKELLKPLYDKLQQTVNVRVKDQPNINVFVGAESMKDDELADNIMAVYNVIKTKLPRGEEQIGKIYIKMTMSRGVIL
ncbi:MAG: 50S ribosomal protein L1 [Candidatus Nanoarchaeia archaeon]|jgi:large subunit ribosomal protein L1